MKKITTNVILWLFSLFTLLLALGGFSENSLAGIFFLITAVLTNPIFLKILRKLGLHFKKIIYIPAVILIWFLGVYAIPTPESSDSAQTPETETSAESDVMSNDIADEADSVGDLADETDTVKDIADETDTIKDTVDDTDAIEDTADWTDAVEDMADKADSVSEDELSDLSIHFIDVGQGDATLIMCDSHAMLIDTGDNSKGTTLQLYLNKQGVDKLDYLVLTHPDADHIGGADVIITKFDIDNIFMSDYTEDTKTYREVLDALKQKNESWSMPAVGDTYALGDAAFTILAPLDTYSSTNDSSIALMLTHGENKFLFTGDCSEDAEDDLVADGQNLSADVYQVGHHGSRYSSSQNLMDAVSPTYAVISCGEDNSYGHPSAEVLNRFRAMGIQVFRTDEQGSIVATSDGTDITWNCAPSDTWKAGESTMSASAASQGTSSKTDNTVNSDIQKSSADKNAAASKTQDTTTIVNEPASDTQNASSANKATATDAQSASATDSPTISDTPKTAPADTAPSSSGTTVSGSSGSGTNPFETGTSPGAGLYIGNKNNGKLHRSTCNKLPKEKNQAIFDTREEAVAAGYNDPCKLCKP